MAFSGFGSHILTRSVGEVVPATAVTVNEVILLPQFYFIGKLFTSPDTKCLASGRRKLGTIINFPDASDRR